MDEHSTPLDNFEADDNFKAVSELFFITTNMLSEIIDAKDPYTEGHSERVRLYSLEIGREMGLPERELAALSLAAKLHDIGKVKIDDRILKKTSALTPEERSELERHSIYSEDLLGRHPVIEPVIEAIRSHHELLNGEGYPDKLHGQSIPRLARIISVADVFDALTSKRVYREDLYSDEDAIKYIVEQEGSRFDQNASRILEKLYYNGKIDYCKGNYYFSRSPQTALEFYERSLEKYSGKDVDKIYLMIGLIENVLWNPEKAIKVLREGAAIRGKYYYRTLTEIAFSEYYMGNTDALHDNYLHQMEHRDELTRLDTMHAYFGALLYFWKTRELEKAIGIIEILDEMFYDSQIEKGLLNRDTLLIAIEKMREIFYDKMMLQAKGYNIMGDITYDLGDYTRAIEYYSSSISIKSITGDLTGRAISLQGSAKVFMQLGRLEDAKIRAMNSYRTNLDKDDKYGMYLASIIMTRVCIESGEIAESRKWLNNVSGLKPYARKEYDRNKYYIVKWLCDLETENPQSIADEVEEKLSSDDFSDFITAEYMYCLGRACESIDREKALNSYRQALEIFEEIRKRPDADKVMRRMELLGGR